MKPRHFVCAAALCPLFALANPACVEPTAAQFKVETLASSGLNESTEYGGPVQMAIAPDGRIFLAKMGSGEVRVYDPATKALTLAGTIPTWASVEDGLLGLALAPDFATTHWLYAFFSNPDRSGPNQGCTLARFTVDAGNKLTNRKNLLFVHRESTTRHAAGGLAMDDNGVLLLGTGDNTNPFGMGGYAPVNYTADDGDAQRSAANSNDLRGKILRIKPLAFDDTQSPAMGIGTTYAIPAGNLWEMIDKPAFNPNWNPAVDSLVRVRKEIYTIGHRNPYHVRVDSRTGWVFWGEVGPDANGDDANAGPAGHDEWNLAKGPGFFGHPYCNGYNRPYGIPTTFTSPYSYSGHYDCGAPVNNSPKNTGIHHLPPSIPALVAYSSGNSKDDDPRFNPSSIGTAVQHAAETAIGGPMYRYDPKGPAGKLPPYYEGKVCFIEWSRQFVRWIVLDSAGRIPAGPSGVRDFLPNALKASWIDAQFGPDGALYLLQFDSLPTYGGTSRSKLLRVSYTGTYDDACYQPFGTPTVGLRPELRQHWAPVAGDRLRIPAGYRGLELFDLQGRLVWSYRQKAFSGETEVSVPARFRRGMWHIRLRP